MTNFRKISTICLTMMILLSFVVLVVPVKAAGAVTLTPNQNVTAGSTVSVTGTGFTASTAVGIGFGAEVTVTTSESHPIPSPSGTGPFTAITNHFPLKPGSLTWHCVVSSDSSVVESDYTDNGDGTCASSSTYALNPFVNYVTGQFGRSTSSAWDGYTVVFTANNYTYYQNNVTPVAGITTNGSGGFTASITVPSVADGVYTVTVVDAKGVKATASIGVGTAIPEGLTMGALVVLSSVALIAGAVLLRKPKVKGLKMAKL
jgi:hypothetical protein